MKKYIFLVLMFLPVLAYADDNPMGLYKDNYILFGDNKDQVKFVISAEYRVSHSFETNWLKNFYVAYTQVSWWKVYNNADTFSSNYQPEIFYRLDLKKDSPKGNIFEKIDYIQLSPIYHSSTGTEGSDHRSVNEYYAQIQSSMGAVHNFGLNLKLFGYWYKNPNNKDINKYRDNYESDLFYKYKYEEKDVIYNAYEIHIRNTGNPFDKGYYMLEGALQLLHTLPKIKPKIFVQYCGGYGVNMVEYNIKKREFRVGLIFTR